MYILQSHYGIGSFCFYRNSPAVNCYFVPQQTGRTYSDKGHMGFDECLQRWDGKPIGIAKRTSEVLSIYDLIHAVRESGLFMMMCCG